MHYEKRRLVGSKRPKVVEKIEEEVSILDLARREHDACEVFSKTAVVAVHEVFKMWCSKTHSRNLRTQLLGITDQRLVDWLQRQFAEYSDAVSMVLPMARGDRDNDYPNDVKRAFGTHETSCSLYRKGPRKATATILYGCNMRTGASSCMSTQATSAGTYG